MISGNSASGILISGGSFNEARGNLIGTDVTGTSPVPNGGAGIAISASETFIGDTAAPNRVAFNTADGDLGALGQRQRHQLELDLLERRARYRPVPPME